MARTLKILQVNANTGVPGSIEVANDFTDIFKGKFYRDSAGAELPFYTTPAPAGYTAIIATKFDIVENSKYNGRYTVYTKVNAGDVASAMFGSGKTTIRVAEIVPALAGGDAPSLATDGYITNISTYRIEFNAGAGTNFVISPGVTLDRVDVDFYGRETLGWGEGYAQNFLNILNHFAGTVAPTAPFKGQIWFDTGTSTLKVWNGTLWQNLATGNVSSYKHSQTVTATSWTVTHNLGLSTPFIASVDCFVDRSGVTKAILPTDIVFTSANQLTVTFSNAETGFVLVRQ